MSRDKLAKLESSGKPIEAEVSSASQMVLACDMSNDQLVARVSAGFQKIASEIPYIIELRARFQRLPRGNANIAGCRTWKEFCEVVLKRSDRRIRQVLADNDSEALAKIDSKTKHELRGVKIDPPLPRSSAQDIEAAVHDVMTTTAPISLNDAAKKHHVQMEEVKRGICKGGKEWLEQLKETQVERPAPRVVVDPLQSVTTYRDPPADRAEKQPPADTANKSYSVTVQPKTTVRHISGTAIVRTTVPEKTQAERKPEPTVVHVEPVPAPEPTQIQEDEEFREEIYERPEGQEDRSMLQYKLVLTVEGSRINSVKKIAHEAFTRDLVSVEKINYGASRQDQLEDALERIEEAKSDIESLRDEMRDVVENTPDNLKGSSKYSEREECVEALDSLIGDLENIDGSSIEFPGMY